MRIEIIPNIEDYVDFDRLRKSNQLGYDWSKVFNVHKTRYMNFIQQIKEDPYRYINKLNKDLQAKLKSDLENMFYASEIENLLINQFYNAIFSVFKKLKMRPETYDDFITYGLLALRSSVWMYRLQDTQFKTFAYNGIYNRVLGMLSLAARQKKKKFKRKLDIMNFSDLSANNISSFEYEKSCSVKVDYENLDVKQLNMEDVIKLSKLSKEDVKLLELYMSRKNGVHGWSKKYRDYLANKKKIIITKQGVSCRVKVLQQRILGAITKFKGQEFVKEFALN